MGKFRRQVTNLLCKDAEGQGHAFFEVRAFDEPGYPVEFWLMVANLRMRDPGVEAVLSWNHMVELHRMLGEMVEDHRPEEYSPQVVS